MQDLNDMYYFARVVEHGGFAPAARAVGVPKSKLSRRVALLEQRLGVRLIQRSTRRFSVTEIGQRFYAHCQAMLVEAEAAQELIELDTAEPRGSVRLACPVALLHFMVAPMLVRFMAECPRVRVTLEATNRRVDVIQEGFDLALRVRFPPLEDSALVMKPLGESPQWMVASPELLKSRSPVRVPADLAGLPSLDLRRIDNIHAWSLTGPEGSKALVPHEPRLTSDDMTMLQVAARSGIGAVQLPTMTVQEDVRAGALIRVLPDWRAQAGAVHVVFASRRGVLPAVRRLIDFLAQEFASATIVNKPSM